MNIFKQMKWYEYLIYFVSIISVVTCGILFHSSIYTVLFSFVGITSVMLVAKGNIWGQVGEVFQGIFYCIISYVNAYFGEVILNAFVAIPMYIFSVITWFRNRNKDTVKVNKNISKEEYLILALSSIFIWGALYYLLGALNTQNLIVSTFSATFGIVAIYLTMRRSEISFVLYIINNVMCLILWLYIAIVGQDLSYLPTVINYVVFILLNTLGIINWVALKKAQASDSFEIIKNVLKEKF